MEYSVLMSVYDKEKPEYLTQSVESMLNQTAKPEQFVLVMDGVLNEGLYAVIAGFKKQNPQLFTIVRIERNVGLGGALERGLKYCRNELVARMDSDDISLPQRCEKELLEFEKDPELAIVGTNLDEFWDDPRDVKCSRVVPSEPEEIRKKIGRIQPFNHPTVMYKKSEVARCGGYGKLPRSEDRDLFSRMISMGCKARNINESLLLFRSDANSYKRRKSWKNCKAAIDVTRVIYRRGDCSFWDLVYVTTGHLALFLMPAPIMKFVSDKLLRKPIIERKNAPHQSHTARQRIRILYLITSCKKEGPVQQTLNIIKHLDKERFEPVLVTLYPENQDGTSQLPKFKKICRHIYAPTGKPEILLGRTLNLTAALERVRPDIVHSLGIFPDYAVSRLQKYPQVITLRNYVWDDYPALYGKVRGAILAKMHLYAIKRADVAVACSKSLSLIYAQKLSLHYGFIRNGVDTDNYNPVPYEQKQQLRQKLKLPMNALIFIYSGPIIKRKNIKFLTAVFEQTFHDENVLLLLLGDGAEYPELLAKYKNSRVMRFTGNVLNVREYLNASDVYVSASKSEGMPNGVLEAMASGLAVILSDIEQHKEIFEENNQIGYLYKQNDQEDLSRVLRRMTRANIRTFSKAAYDSARLNFSAAQNCEQYEQLYQKLWRDFTRKQ